VRIAHIPATFGVAATKRTGHQGVEPGSIHAFAGKNAVGDRSRNRKHRQFVRAMVDKQWKGIGHGTS
jgi:hypothetical protein